MKLNVRGCLMMLLMLALCLTMSVSALAEQPAVTVGVTVKLEGSPLPDPAEVFTIQLKSKDAANPMPKGAVDGVSETAVTGAGRASLPEITFQRVGVYEYTISQVAGKRADCAYDSSVYHLTVYVVNSESGSGLEATAVLYRNSEGDKLSAAEFVNVYPTVTPAPTAEPGDVTKTGVTDRWPAYLAGAAILLVLAGVLAATLLRKGHGEQTTK